MDGISATGLRGGKDLVGAQVAVGGRGRADMHGLVGFADMFRGGVGVGIDGNRADSEGAAGGHDATGDFAAIGDEEFGDLHSASLGTSWQIVNLCDEVLPTRKMWIRGEKCPKLGPVAQNRIETRHDMGEDLFEQFEPAEVR